MKPTTELPTLTSASFEDLVQEMIVRLGEDPHREGLQLTPQRVRKSLQFLTRERVGE
jgi:GTP cyclohydrolase I